MAEIDRWALERACWARGIALVCGCDEAGAGPLAGAVYAGAVILPPECSIEGLNDSKQVTPKRRDALYDTIRTVAVAWAVARVEAEEIDATDILSARIKAMQMAIDRLEPAPGFALIDGNRDHGRGGGVTTPHRCIVNGAPDGCKGRQLFGLDRRSLYPGQGEPGPLYGADGGTLPGI